MTTTLIQSAQLALALGLAWSVLAGPAYLLAGWSAIIGLTGAVVLCLLPGPVAMALQSGSLAARQPVAGMLIATGLRMALVLGAVLVVRKVMPELPASVFVIWLIPVYLVALAVETWMALSGAGRECAAPDRMRASGSP